MSKPIRDWEYEMSADCIKADVSNMRVVMLPLLAAILLGSPLHGAEKPADDTSSKVSDGRSIVKLHYNYPSTGSHAMLAMRTPDTSKPEVVSLFVNDEFVGHAIPRLRILPELRLLAGRHTLRFQSEGYATFVSQLYVIGGGSTQFVVVSMNPSTGSDLDAGSDLEPVPAPTLEPLGSESEEEVIEEVGSRSDFK
jgi:hypothetical protein